MESTPEQVAESSAVVKVLAIVLGRLIGVNSSIQDDNPGTITKFHALKPPSISVLAYLERIHKYASCSTECFILALIYIDRLIQRNNFILSELNVHRVVITSIMLAAKFFDDAYYNNAYYAKVGGVLVSEMNSLEVEFLFRLNFSLHVTPELFGKYHAELVAHAVATSPIVGSPLLPTISFPLSQKVQSVCPPEVTPEPKPEIPPNPSNEFQPKNLSAQKSTVNYQSEQPSCDDMNSCNQYGQTTKNSFNACITSQYISHHIACGSSRILTSGGIA